MMKTIDFSADPFPPLAAEHPAVGMACALCAKPFVAGDVTAPVPLAFVGQTEMGDHDLYVRFRGRREPAALVHADCAVHKVREIFQ